MKRKPYLIDAVIGNSKMLASLGKNGEIYRMWWPHIDYPQHIDEMIDGIYINGVTEETLWRNEGRWEYTQEYVENTNILKHTAVHPDYEIKLSSIDYCVPGEDILVRNYTIENIGQDSLDVNFLNYSNLAICENDRYNTVYFDYENDALVHYRHEYFFAIGGSLNIDGFTSCNNAKEDALDGTLNGVQIGMGKEGAISLELGVIAPSEKRNFSIFITASKTNKDNAFNILKKARILGQEKLYEITEEYWHNYLAQSKKVETGNEELDDLYRRSLLTFKLMSDETTGGFIAAPEFDEDFSKCGGYAYCWGRDAAYIATAVCKSGYGDTSKRFYEWAVKAQEKDGSWEHRHYMEGYMAPAWGLQVDETGSILWGMWQQYKETEDVEFIKTIWKNVKCGVEFLEGFIDKETNLPRPSMDLWEERKAEHTYSAAAVYGGFIGAAEIAKALGYNDLTEQWSLKAIKIKESIEEKLWNEDKECFYRGIKLNVSKEDYVDLKAEGVKVTSESREKNYVDYMKFYDDIVDISLLGLTVPFGVIDAKDEKMVKTAECIEKLLWNSKVGGIKRYEDDIYIGGNPWILTTLWLGLYYIKIGKVDKVKEIVAWIIDHRTAVGLLPEQIDKNTGETAWVVPLTWSHAMLVLIVLEMVDNNIEFSK